VLNETGEAQDTYDAVVVGAGLGGLTCAAYLAVGGKRVLVLEHHDIAGGNSHVFRRKRAYEFDVGVHYLGDCGPDGVLPAILSGLGLGDRVRFREMDRAGFDRIVLPGLVCDMPVGWDAYLAALTAALPDEAGGFAEFARVCAAVGAEMRGLLLTPDEVAVPELLRLAPVTMEWGRRTLDELFTACGFSAEARTLLAAQSLNYGMSPSQATVATHATVTDHYLRGAYYPEGGGQVLAASLVEVIEAHGGELRTRATVERITVADGAVTGVRLRDGTEVRAELVVSNADYSRTVLELVGPEHFPSRTVAKTRAAEPGWPMVVAYVVLDRPVTHLPNANVWWHRGDDIDAAYQGLLDGSVEDVPFAFLSFASTKDPGNRLTCPPGHTNFQIMTLVPPGPGRWGVERTPTEGGRYRRDPAYQAEKQRITDLLIAAAEEAIGPFRENIVHLETATPLTQERYTRSTGGTPFGLARWGAAGSRPEHRTPVRGLHVVGQGTRFGCGVMAVMTGGVSCAAQILDQRLLAQAHAGVVFGDPALLPRRPADWDPVRVSRGSARRGARGLALSGRR
jgi:all-trans-retinol 13,14-reductase